MSNRDDAEVDQRIAKVLKMMRRSIAAVEESFKNDPVWPDAPYHHAMPFGVERFTSDPDGEKLFGRWSDWVKTLNDTAADKELERSVHLSDLFYREYFARLVKEEGLSHKYLTSVIGEFGDKINSHAATRPRAAKPKPVRTKATPK
jgi:hypothetical protein